MPQTLPGRISATRTLTGGRASPARRHACCGTQAPVPLPAPGSVEASRSATRLAAITRDDRRTQGAAASVGAGHGRGSATRLSLIRRGLSTNRAPTVISQPRRYALLLACAQVSVAELTSQTLAPDEMRSSAPTPHSRCSPEAGERLRARDAVATMGHDTLRSAPARSGARREARSGGRRRRARRRPRRVRRDCAGALGLLRCSRG